MFFNLIFGIIKHVFLLLSSASLIIAILGFSPIFTSDRQVAGISSFVVTKTPNLTHTPTQIPSPTPTPSLKPTPTKALLNQTVDLLQQINSFRTGKGLPPLFANSETCFFANLRSQEIISSFNHNGFRGRIDSNTLPYPSYSEVAENIAMNNDQNQVVPGWIASSGHNENLSKDVPYGCVVGNGDYYVFEAWRP